MKTPTKNIESLQLQVDAFLERRKGLLAELNAAEFGGNEATCERIRRELAAGAGAEKFERLKTLRDARNAEKVGAARAAIQNLHNRVEAEPLGVHIEWEVPIARASARGIANVPGDACSLRSLRKQARKRNLAEKRGEELEGSIWKTQAN